MYLLGVLLISASCVFLAPETEGILNQTTNAEKFH